MAILTAIKYCFTVMVSYSNMLHALRPHRVSGFSYSWLELVSHRIMISRLLGNSQQKVVHYNYLDCYHCFKIQHIITFLYIKIILMLLQGWAHFQQLLLDLFKFLAPFLRNAELAKQTQLLYKVCIIVRFWQM